MNNKTKIENSYPLISSQNRLSVWKKMKGMWKNKSNKIKELQKIREEWDRKITLIN